MKKYLETLMNSKLFLGLNENELLHILNCINAHLKHFKKGDYILRVNEHVDYLMLICEGQVCIQLEDYWGNCNVLNILEIGEIFGEAYLTPNKASLLNNVIATKDATIMYFEIEKLLNLCQASCKFHSKVVLNLFYEISNKNKSLVTKLGIISKRTIRDKLITYLSKESIKHKSSIFDIPFNRQQLADYLAIDRSALSYELSKMRNEGLIKYHKNHFELIQ